MMSLFSRRIIAYILDFFVVSSVMWIFAYLLSLMLSPLDVTYVYAAFPYIAPVLGFIYFVFLEKSKGSTVGKAIMYLEVRSRNGAYINWPQAIVRNLTKIYWVPIIFDWLIGRIMKTDRFLCKITKTVVVDMV